MSPAFEHALDTLLNQINPTSGLGHPSDFRRAVEMFQWLIESGEKAEQDAIATYLLDNSVSTDVASEIQRLYETLLAARNFPANKWWPD